MVAKRPAYAPRSRVPAELSPKCTERGSKVDSEGYEYSQRAVRHCVAFTGTAGVAALPWITIGNALRVIRSLPTCCK